MTISVVQSVATNGGGGGAAGKWLSTFGAGVTAGNTLFLVVFAYDSGTLMSAGSPTYNGSAFGAASQVFGVSSTGGGNVFEACYMFPNIGSGGGTTLGATCAGGMIDGNVGSIAYEVAGLGTAPAVDKAPTPATGSTGNISSSSTGATGFAPEFVIGASVAFAVNQAAASGFTTLWNNGGTGFCEAGYQIPTSSGGSFTWAANTGVSADWCAAIATAYASAGAPASLPPQPYVVPSLAAIQAASW